MAQRVKCLVIEDDEQVRGLLTAILGQQEFAVTTALSAEDGIEAAEADGFDVVLCDISLPGRSGIEALGALRDACADAPVILVTGYPSIESAIEGMRAGAFDYITKPFNREELLMVIERALDHSALERENRTLRNLARDSSFFAGIIGESAAIRDIVSRIQRISGSRSNVLLSGESGTGKEVISRAIHQTGPTANEPFLAINCSAIPGELLETELFGHVRGAFTGASTSKRGLFEEAGRGTIFLDEIGDMDLGLQSKLLRALQQREVRPVGGTRAVAIKARIISATNRNLREAIENGSFRRDLFYRLNVIPIHVPPLRERVEDIPLLAEHFLEKHSGGKERRLSPAALAVLTRRAWEGNARELENVIERALVLSDSSLIQPEDLPFEEPTPEAAEGELERLFEVAAESGITVRQLADRYIARVVELTGGNKAQAARRLGVAVRTLYRRKPGAQPPADEGR